jgi:hypothetical protein
MVTRWRLIAPAGQPIIPGRVEWLRAEMLKTTVVRRVAALLPGQRRIELAR